MSEFGLFNRPFRGGVDYTDADAQRDVDEINKLYEQQEEENIQKAISEIDKVYEREQELNKNKYEPEETWVPDSDPVPPPGASPQNHDPVPPPDAAPQNPDPDPEQKFKSEPYNREPYEWELARERERSLQQEKDVESQNDKDVESQNDKDKKELHTIHIIRNYDINKERRLKKLSLILLSSLDSQHKKEVEKKVGELIRKELEKETLLIKEKTDNEIMSLVKTLIKKTSPKKKLAGNSKKKSAKKKSVKKKSVKKPKRSVKKPKRSAKKPK